MIKQVLVSTVLVLAVGGTAGACTAESLSPTASTPTTRLATLTIRPAALTSVPADITTAFAIDGDPDRDRPLGSRCSLRSLVISGQGTHGHGDTGGLCGTATSGDWTPLLGGPVAHDPTTLDIGYVIPLAEAWRSGANQPDFDRAAFATDPTWERTVITPGSDQARGDHAPDAWQPAASAQCHYVGAWINAKWAWHLSMTQAEHDAFAAALATCLPTP
jgi:hypothetical protein